MTIMTPTRLGTAQAARVYMLGGRATITLNNNDTGKFLTYKITVSPKDARFHFVWAHFHSGYRFVGTIAFGRKFSRSPKSIPSNFRMYKAFVWVWRHLINGSMPRPLSVYHSNTCRRCGRKLTTPKSMSLGIGPECIKMNG